MTATLLEDAHPGSGSGGWWHRCVGGTGSTGLAGRVEHASRGALARRVATLVWQIEHRFTVWSRGGGPQQQAIWTSLYCQTDSPTRVWRSTARASFDNRAPREDTLRAIEFVPQGTRFEGFVEVPENELSDWDRLLKEVDALGAGTSHRGRARAIELGSVSRRRFDRSGQATNRLVLVLCNLDPVCVTATATP